MDDNVRFDQLEEIIVELLRKQDRTIEEVGRLREAVVAQQLLLARLQSDVNRLEVESASTRRQLAELTNVVHKGFEELTIAYRRNERLLQETADILARHELYHLEAREALARHEVYHVETRETLARHEVYHLETREVLAENKMFQQETRETLARHGVYHQETREALAETRTILTKILDLLTKP